jgi:hypothetical protein
VEALTEMTLEIDYLRTGVATATENTRKLTDNVRQKAKRKPNNETERKTQNTKAQTNETRTKKRKRKTNAKKRNECEQGKRKNERKAKKTNRMNESGIALHW